MVATFLKNGRKMIYQEQKTILSGAFVIGALMLLGKILGLVKVRLYAGVLGAGEVYDTFVAADRLPDLMFHLIIVGSLNAAFIPLFSEYISRKGSKNAWQFASSVMNWAVLVFAVVGVIIFVFAHPLSYLVAAGFSPDQRADLVPLMRIMLIAPIILGVSSYVSGMLQSFRRFFIPFLSPLLYNLGGIFGLMILYPIMGVTGLAWGAVVGAVMHLIVQIPLLLHLGFQYRFTLAEGKELMRLVSLSLPRTIGLAAEQIKILVITNFASLLAVGSISILWYAESIYMVPITIIGASIAQASLPALAEEASKKNNGHFNQTFIASLHQVIFLIVPAMVIMIVLKIPVVRLILGIGQFDWEATVLTSWVMAILTVGLIAQAANTLIMRGFFALQETKLPVLVGVIGVVTSILLSATFMSVWEIRGLALGITIGTILEFILLLWLLDQRVRFNRRELLGPVVNIGIAGVVMAAMILIPVRVLDQVFIDTSRVVNLLILVWLVLTLGGSTYIILTWILGVEQVRMFFKILWKLRDYKEALITARSLQPPQQPSLLEE